jgi:predicted nucleic acid-binding protein
MIVVSDSSPLIGLSVTGHLWLLKALYQTIAIPEAVFREVVLVGQGRAGVQEVLDADWILVQSVNQRPLVLALLGELDEGEAEAIILTMELDAEFLIMDERRGRRAAQRLGLSVIGVLGVLLEAKKKGLLSSVSPVVKALIEIAGFRLSEELVKSFLFMAGEEGD